jgi:uncharacterized protein (DUF885 family)
MKATIMKLSPIAAALFAITACSPATESTQTTTSHVAAEHTTSQTESERLNAFFENAFNEDLKRSPLFQSYLGKKWDYDKWDDISEAESDKSVAIAKERLSTLASFDTSKLSEQEQLSLRLYKLGIKRNLANDAFRHHRYIVHQFRAAHTQVPSFLINIHRVSSKEDAQAYIGRLNGVNKYFGQVIDQMKVREALGVFPPAWAYDQMIEASKNVITGAPFEENGAPSTILEDFQSKVAGLALSDEEKEQLIADANTALLRSVMPAYQKLIAELSHQQALTPAGDGVWRLPDGEAWYQNRLNWFTTTDLTADEVHQIGVDNVERIHNAMRDIMKEVGFEGTLQ